MKLSRMTLAASAACLLLFAGVAAACGERAARQTASGEGCAQARAASASGCAQASDCSPATGTARLSSFGDRVSAAGVGCVASAGCAGKAGRASASGCHERGAARAASASGCSSRSAQARTASASGCRSRAAQARTASATGCRSRAAEARTASASGCASRAAQARAADASAVASAPEVRLTAAGGGCGSSCTKPCCAGRAAQTASRGDSERSCDLPAGRRRLVATVHCAHCDLQVADSCQTMLRTENGCTYAVAAGEVATSLKREAGHGTKVVQVRARVMDDGSVTVLRYRVIRDAEDGVGL